MKHDFTILNKTITKYLFSCEDKYFVIIVAILLIFLCSVCIIKSNKVITIGSAFYFLLLCVCVIYFLNWYNNSVWILILKNFIEMSFHSNLL
jgi:hypothetical protein